MITEIGDYFAKGCGRCARFDTADCSARRWAEGLSALRVICLSTGMTETVKWGHPCYMHAGRNIALIGALRGDFRLSFFNASLLMDSHGLLERQGPNSQHPDTMRFDGGQRVTELAPFLTACLHEAMAFAEAGTLPPKEKADIVLQDELVEALDCDPELAEAFHALTPGRKRSYVIALASTNSPATRRSRIERFREKIIVGKGANER